MARSSKTITFSLPPEMADLVEEVRRREGRTTSELIREALRRYVEEREWRDMLRYGDRRAQAEGLTPEDVERLIDEYRDETRQTPRRS